MSATTAVTTAVTAVTAAVRSWEMATGIDDVVCACMGKKYENVPVVNWISGDDNLDYDMCLSDFGLGDKEIFDDWIETMDRFKASNLTPYEFADKDKLCFESWRVMNVKVYHAGRVHEEGQHGQVHPRQVGNGRWIHVGRRRFRCRKQGLPPVAQDHHYAAVRNPGQVRRPQDHSKHILDG